jgi:hypothetical protein
MRVLINLAPQEMPSGKVREPLVETPKRKNEMPDAVKVAIIRAGCYTICSDEVLKVLAPRVQYMEFAEQYGDREREERTTYGGKHTNKMRGETLTRFGGMLAKAEDAEILDFIRKGYLEIPRNKWKSEEVRRAAVKALVKALGKDAKEIIQDDFDENGLRGAMPYYRSSPYEALRDAGFEMKPWEMRMAPNGFWGERGNRVEAVKWLVARLGKDAREIIKEDFEENGLGGLLVHQQYEGSPYAALKEAGFEMKPWEMVRVPIGFWDSRKNRVEAIRWMVAKTGKKAREIKSDDFDANGLAALVCGHYGGSPYAALRDAGFKMKPWEMASAPDGTWEKKENRVEAIRWMAGRLGKKAREITFDDFVGNGFSGLVDHYGNSPYEALLEAGLVTEADEAYMRSRRHTLDGENAPIPASEGVEN